MAAGALGTRRELSRGVEARLAGGGDSFQKLSPSLAVSVSIPRPHVTCRGGTPPKGGRSGASPALMFFSLLFGRGREAGRAPPEARGLHV